jgi:ABC-2 type transport system permease protein
MRRFWILLKTELKLALRSPDAILFSLAMPVVVLVVIGLIYKPGQSAGMEGRMIEETFGAFMAIGICAIGLMGLPLTLADYRHKKVLKRMQVTPVHPGLLLGIQFTVQTLMALLSAGMVALAALVFFELELKGSLLSVLTAYLIVLVSIFSIGILIASTARDIKRAGIICSIVYFPMLLFSGTTIPFHVFPDSVQIVAQVLPLRQGIILLNGISNGNSFSSYILHITILAAITFVSTAVSIRSFRWDMERSG